MSQPKYIELNMSNYDSDDVSQLNQWGIWAAGRIEELEALLKSFPRTADGATIVPGMRVWYVCRAMQFNPICWSRVCRVGKDMWDEQGGGQPYYIRDGEPCFSSEKLAKEYKAKQLQEIADKAREDCSA